MRALRSWPRWIVVGALGASALFGCGRHHGPGGSGPFLQGGAGANPAGQGGAGQGEPDRSALLEREVGLGRGQEPEGAIRLVVTVARFAFPTTRPACRAAESLRE